MDIGMEQFWEDLETGEVHIRDRWQFTLKSEYFPEPGKPNQCLQEFYLFIPNTLQINSETYSKRQFYEDQTNFIRYKTPLFTFEELFDKKNRSSPLTRMMSLCAYLEEEKLREKFVDELKLFGNVARSTLRGEVKGILVEVEKNNDILNDPMFKIKCEMVIEDVYKLREKINALKSTFLKTWNNSDIYKQILYVEEFCWEHVEYYLTNLLEVIHQHTVSSTNPIEKTIKDLLLKENLHGSMVDIAVKGYIDTSEGESITHKKSLLNKYVMDALQLYTNRFSSDQSFQHWIGAISAGVAMFIYFALFFWLGNVFVINSAPFLLIMVFTYILKDRIKEWLRNISYQNVSKWFPDYITEIYSPDRKSHIGKMKESFSFIEEPQLSEEIRSLRNAEFHEVLETVKRPESVLYYKKNVTLATLNSEHISRRSDVNIIFRFNIHRFLRKANEPYEEVLAIEPSSQELKALYLPKVYHLNLIMRTTLGDKIELKKLRIIINKNGIKRIEQISKS